MNLIEDSFQRLLPDKELKFETELQYNRRLSDFNANVKLANQKISINLNLQWKDIDQEIKIGLVQSLLNKLFSKKINTPNIELYNNFVRNIPLLIPKVNINPELKKSFLRVNEKFFSNSLEMPNLKWGMDSKRKLASYNFHNDTVTVSSIFQEAEIKILDYLMYHELLHKHQKFKYKNGRSYFHTPDFKRAESLYPNQKEIEKEINVIIKKKKKKGLWRFF
jgi:hypothetical protein